MHTVLIAGAGQLGSRHLQGIKQSQHELDIWVYDLSEQSLAVAEERYNQIESNITKQIHFVTSLSLIPYDIDIAIVASSSKPRCSIVTELLGSHNVKYMILEKFLFPRLVEYDLVEKMIKEKGVKTWVNCPRRMWNGYDLIERHINPNQPILMEYTDTDWGLCCNSVHYIDIFMKLNGCDCFDVNIDELVSEVIESKRNGYVELRGTEKFRTNNGSMLSLSSIETKVENPVVTIDNGGTHIEYAEGSGIIRINGIESKVDVHYQSGLSGILVDELIDSESCRLATYTESSVYHKLYLQVVSLFINKITGWTSDSCPIT